MHEVPEPAAPVARRPLRPGRLWTRRARAPLALDPCAVLPRGRLARSGDVFWLSQPGSAPGICRAAPPPTKEPRAPNVQAPRLRSPMLRKRGVVLTGKASPDRGLCPWVLQTFPPSAGGGGAREQPSRGRGCWAAPAGSASWALRCRPQRRASGSGNRPDESSGSR